MTLENAEKVANLIKRLNYLKAIQKRIDMQTILNKDIMVKTVLVFSEDIAITDLTLLQKFKKDIKSTLELEIKLVESELDLF